MAWPVWKSFIQRKGKLSDIEFLAIKDNDGKLVENEGNLSAAGTLASLTASSGKDLYVAKAKINAYWNTGTPGNGIDSCIVELQANSVVKETAHLTLFFSTSPANGSEVYEFIWVGKVAESEVIKLEVTSIGAEVDVEGTLVGFEEDTDASPQV